MSEAFPKLAEVIRKSPLEQEIDLKPGVLLNKVKELYPERYKDTDILYLEELPEEIFREALTDYNKGRVRNVLAPAIFSEYKEGAHVSPELHEFFKLMDELVDSAYEISGIINQNDLHTQELKFDDKMKLNQASKSLAELVGMVGYDAKISLKLKVFFVEALLQGFNIYKHRNQHLREAMERSDGAYLRAEEKIVGRLQYYLDSWMRGAVDIEAAVQQAVEKSSFVKSVESATCQEDVAKGVDFWFRIDLDEMEKQGEIDSSRLDDEGKHIMGSRVAIQVKSNCMEREIFKHPGSIASSSVHGSKNYPDTPFVEDCRSKETGKIEYCRITIDVKTVKEEYLKADISYGKQKVNVSQLDFERAISDLIFPGNLDKIPKMIFNKYAVPTSEKASEVF